MFTRWTFTLAILISFNLVPYPSSAYYGLRSTEAQLTFQASLETDFSDFVIPCEDGGSFSIVTLNQKGSPRKQALKKVRNQLQFLVGTFQSESFYQEFGYRGILGEDHRSQIEFIDIEDTPDPKRKKLSYQFKGTVVFDKQAFGNASYKNAIRTVPIKLPLSPDRIYKLSLVKGFNPCTDPEYNTEDDFWYFWDPDLKKCSLKKDSKNVIRTFGTLVRKKSTLLTYPEYDRLFGDNLNGETLNIALFFGYIDEIDILSFRHSKRVRRRKRDDAYDAYRSTIQELKKRGFRITHAKELFRVYPAPDGKHHFTNGLNFLTRLQKQVPSELGTTIDLKIQILLADTSIDAKDATFHHYIKPAFESADIVLYDGHSGLGGNLDLTSQEFQDIQFTPNKYQIYFFNGCSTYPYFNGSFFNKKGGRKNLEIITSGLPTLTATSVLNTLAFLDYFLEGKTRSYQKILQNLTRSNFEEEEDLVYLLGVNGDEDNSFRP
ncbi:MAG: hypothetical protein A3B70_06445 [Deltaproteobacteria bacterium RIFCSPHIGHO2_02_FULL_40_11]|nr:MAG: hypothetical protein A3B70_06445 [Deltaproteobacteria bacterium RIFCSPHIGHO2_02_FULL_40_11]